MVVSFWPRRSWQFYLARLWRKRCRQPQDLLHTVITAVCYKHTGHVCSVWRQRFCNHRANAERTASEQRRYARQFPSNSGVHISAMIYLSVLNPPNTTFLAPPCFLGIMNLGNGTPTPAILSGRW